jgi:hypothetical protein
LVVDMVAMDMAARSDLLNLKPWLKLPPSLKLSHGEAMVDSVASVVDLVVLEVDLVASEVDMEAMDTAARSAQLTPSPRLIHGEDMEDSVATAVDLVVSGVDSVEDMEAMVTESN